MPVMSSAEAILCRSAPWRAFAGRVVLPWMLSGMPISGRVLEIGGGSGAMAEVLLRRAPDIDLTLTDVDAAMVDAARRRLKGTDSTVEVADVTALPFGDGSFDAVASFLMLHHVVDWRHALAEAHRVLRPGGALVGYDLTRSAIARWFHQVDRSVVELLSADGLRDGLTMAGFGSVEVSPARGNQWMRFRAVKAEADATASDANSGKVDA